MGLRTRLKQVLRGTATVTGFRRYGFYIPYAHASSVPESLPPYAAAETAFANCRQAFDTILDEIAGQARSIAQAVQGDLKGRWDNGFISRLDGAAIWAMITRTRPRKVIEVGSGSTTHIMAAAGASLAPPPELVCIDPAPRADISALGVRWQEEVLSHHHVPLFEALQPGDIAFFDSSHVLHEGTDVDIIQNHILPALAPGVLIHVHDIILPDPYPAIWAGRAYTEQLGLGGWLFSGAVELFFASHYAATRMKDEVAQALAGIPGHSHGGGSIWFSRRAL